MHNMKRYQTTQKQTHEGCAAHKAQNVVHYHCSKDLLATLLDFPNHRFFAVKVKLNTLLYDREEAIITEQLLRGFEFLKIRFL